MIDLDKLNQGQKEAVITTEGPVLIIAGPGSGKTFTLVKRAVYLITKKQIEPSRLLIATFTEKAAQELKTRISNRLIELNFEININDMYVGTIHSICLRIIEENLEFSKLRKNFRVVDEFEQKYIVYKNLKQFKEFDEYKYFFGNGYNEWGQSGNIIKYINKLSEENVDPLDLIEFYDRRIVGLGKVYKKYLEILNEENILDFSKIQTEAFRILKENSEILKKIQNDLNYFMIDEYQDTNLIQEKIILLISDKTKNLCVVGDDDQGIYRFRGATIRNILEFPQYYEKGKCKIIKLDTNYRSHPDIVNFYDNWMRKLEWNGCRYEKKMKPYHKKEDEIDRVIKVSTKTSDEDWCNSIYDFLIQMKIKGIITDYNQVAFLFRSVKNYRIKLLSKYLEDRGISVYSPRSAMFFERREVRLMLGALLSLFPQYRKELSLKLKEFNNEEKHYYKFLKNCLDEFIAYVRSYNDSEFLEWARKKIDKYKNLTENTDSAFSGIFYELLQFSPFKDYLIIDEGKCVDSRENRNLATFSKIIVQFEFLENIILFTPQGLIWNLRKFFNMYIRYLFNGGINEYENMNVSAPSSHVSFMTIHQSKGMEFPIVFVGSLDWAPKNDYKTIDKLLENNFYIKPPFEIESRIKYYDFWRLYYTAFSRAQNLLVLTCNEGNIKKMEPSKYFKGIYSPLIDFRNPNFKKELIELEHIKEVTIKPTFSFTSHMLVFENCARQYKFFKELEFIPVRREATVFGNLVHQTIEDINNKAIKKQITDISVENIKMWLEENYDGLTKATKTYLAPHIKKVALEQVTNYFKRENNNLLDIKESEKELSIVRDNYILQGTLDLVREKNGKIEIIDFKSSEIPDLKKDKEILEVYKNQLEIYAYLLEEKGHIVDNIKLYYTSAGNKNPYIKFEKSREGINETIKTFDIIVNNIKNKNFKIDKKPGKICQNCDMKYHCNKR